MIFVNHTHLTRKHFPFVKQHQDTHLISGNLNNMLMHVCSSIILKTEKVYKLVRKFSL